MQTLTLVLFLVISILISAIIDRVVPRVSLPLIQVVLGACIAIFAREAIDIDLEPDLFLVLFIAPLLYIEAKDADKSLLWGNKNSIIWLAIGLVIITALVVGFVLHWIEPSVSLAAAFALGAALGPTDAVAVTSLSKQVSIPERLQGMLKGELLLNDASGIVSFQFAIAAASTGVFSLAQASVAFLEEFLGGLLFGLVIGYLANLLLRTIRDIGIESTTFHVLYELCIPFIVYLSATAIHVSGIIAVVVAGLLNVIKPRTMSPNIAHMNIVSSNVWQVMSFVLNGTVFVILGTQIPSSMYYTWENPSIPNSKLIMFVLIVTAVLVLVRFLWCTGMEAIYVKREHGRRLNKSDLRNAAILTFCGSKGAITLSILFTIPVTISTGQYFPGRHLIIFIGCGVILLTLLMANFLVPIVSPKKVSKKTEEEARQNYYEVLSDILRNVIEGLTKQITPASREATIKVINTYQTRLQNTKNNIDIDDDPNIELRIKALQWEQKRAMELVEEGKVPRDVGLTFVARLERLETLTEHRDSRNVFKRVWGYFRLALNQMKHRLRSNAKSASMLTERQDQMRELQLDTARYAANILRSLVTDERVQTEDASKLLLFYEKRINVLKPQTPTMTDVINVASESDDVFRIAYQMELEEIQKMYEEDKISRSEANRMRDNVHVMQMDLDDKLS